MLIVALVLAVIGLAALVTAVVTSNELVAWVCIGASVIGVVLLIIDALRERSTGDSEDDADRDDETTGFEQAAEDYPDEPADDTETLTPHVPSYEQAVDQPNEDLPPNATPERR